MSRVDEITRCLADRHSGTGGVLGRVGSRPSGKSQSGRKKEGDGSCHSQWRGNSRDGEKTSCSAGPVSPSSQTKVTNSGRRHDDKRFNLMK